MDFGSPQEWQQGAGALKQAVDAFAGVLKMFRDFRNAPGAPTALENKAADEALQQAEVAAKVAEAQLAKALGYQLCHCAFPPTAMLTVGARRPRGGEPRIEPVFECPACGYNTARTMPYDRIAPPREAPAASGQSV
ncbi:MAG: hypothetical protein AB7E79_05100 [Rhodospirillaceae bacterium]